MAIPPIPNTHNQRGREVSDYVIWSNEHRAWWGPEHRGYYTHLSAAGRYSRDEALRICVNARGGRRFNENPSEVPLLLADAEIFWTDALLLERQEQEREDARRRAELELRTGYTEDDFA